ncbi:hypothetical protein [Pseudomonas vranovensis]|uniref:Uncharacterized protein n=1 Tax=Pseudomonas vranovensis TaxID=321661 RepID=A0A423CZW2_9PSED|nr:hypothetical protein [Pseudomonas vranovensis]ROL64841.1 hypothetical protein BHU25_23505 [Pseudomonas vranovensis]
MDDPFLPQRLFAAAAIIVAVIGGGIFIFILASPGGPFPSLGNALAVFTLGITNGLCLPLVGTYWSLAGKPASAATLLILQVIGLIAFIGWYASLV